MIRTQRYPTIYNNPSPAPAFYPAPPPYPAPTSCCFAPPFAAFTNKHHSTHSACKRGTENGPKRRKGLRVYSKSALHGPPSVNAASPGRAWACRTGGRRGVPRHTARGKRHRPGRARANSARHATRTEAQAQAYSAQPRVTVRGQDSAGSVCPEDETLPSTSGRSAPSECRKGSRRKSRRNWEGCPCR